MVETKPEETSIRDSMAENDAKQDGNTVGGDLAGRDIIHRNTIYGQTTTVAAPEAIRTLMAKLAQQRADDPQLDRFIDELDYFYRPIEGNVKGLEAKLEEAHKPVSFIAFALRVKEQYHKQLVRNQFSEIAQKLNVQLLALVQSYFMNHIHPKISEGAEPSMVQELVMSSVVMPLMHQLDDNTLGFTAQDIEGMLYFLTGNCHINWTGE